MRRKVRRWVVWCVAIVAAGCGPSPVQVTGQWTGTMTEVVNQWNGSFSFNLSQSGENVSGAWIASNNPNVGGPVSGKVDGTEITLEFGQNVASNCGYKINAGVSGMTTMSGSYDGMNCPAFPNLHGQFTASK